MKAFQSAKDIAEAELADTSATKVTMPFVEDHLERVKNIMGADFWTYGLDKSNRFVIESFLKQHHRQGLSKRLLSVDEMFPANSIEGYSL